MQLKGPASLLGISGLQEKHIQLKVSVKTLWAASYATVVSANTSITAGDATA